MGIVARLGWARVRWHMIATASTWHRLLTTAAIAAWAAGSAHAADPSPGAPAPQPALQLQLAENSGLQSPRSQPSQVAAPPAQQWSIGLTGLYTERKGETAGWAPDVEVNYSPTDRLQLHAMLPFAYDQLSGGPTHYGP